MINGWQHKGSFVIKFFPKGGPDGGRFYGRIEHVESGESTRFESEQDLLMFLNKILKRVVEFQQADTLAEEVPGKTKPPDSGIR